MSDSSSDEADLTAEGYERDGFVDDEIVYYSSGDDDPPTEAIIYDAALDAPAEAPDDASELPDFDQITVLRALEASTRYMVIDIRDVEGQGVEFIGGDFLVVRKPAREITCEKFANCRCDDDYGEYDPVYEEHFVDRIVALTNCATDKATVVHRIPQRARKKTRRGQNYNPQHRRLLGFSDSRRTSWALPKCPLVVGTAFMTPQMRAEHVQKCKVCRYGYQWDFRCVCDYSTDDPRTPLANISFLPHIKSRVTFVVGGSCYCHAIDIEPELDDALHCDDAHTAPGDFFTMSTAGIVQSILMRAPVDLAAVIASLAASERTAAEAEGDAHADADDAALVEMMHAYEAEPPAAEAEDEAHADDNALMEMMDAYEAAPAAPIDAPANNEAPRVAAPPARARRRRVIVDDGDY